MPERRKKLRIVLLHIVLLPTILYVFSFFTLAPKSWTGVDETVVEKIAQEHGRAARKPLMDPGEGDLLLFAFLLAGGGAGFAAGYWWRMLVSERKKTTAQTGTEKEG